MPFENGRKPVRMSLETISFNQFWISCKPFPSSDSINPITTAPVVEAHRQARKAKEIKSICGAGRFGLQNHPFVHKANHILAPCDSFKLATWPIGQDLRAIATIPNLTHFEFFLICLGLGNHVGLAG